MSDATASSLGSGLLLESRDSLQYQLNFQDLADFEIASTVATETTLQSSRPMIDTTTRRKRKKNYRVLDFLGFCIFFDMFIFVPSIRPYIHQVGGENSLATTDTLFAVSRAVFSLSQFIVVPLCSYAISNFGKTKNLLVLFLCFYLAGNLLYILAFPLKSVALIILARLFSGVGAGINRLFFEYLSRTVNSDMLASEFGYFRLATNLSLILGAILNAWVYPHIEFSFLSYPINYMTGPALSCFCLFLICFFIVIFFFNRDPIPSERKFNFSPCPPMDKSVLYILFLNFSAQFIFEWQLYTVTTTAEGLYNWDGSTFATLFLIMAVNLSFFSLGTKYALQLNYFKSRTPTLILFYLIAMLFTIGMMYFGHQKGHDAFAIANVVAFGFFGLGRATFPELAKILVETQHFALLPGWENVISGIGRVVAPNITDAMTRVGETPEYLLAFGLFIFALLFNGLLWWKGILKRTEDRFENLQDDEMASTVLSSSR